MGDDVASKVLTDQALLERFLQERDEDAFAELVCRHGPMVRATCLRYLGNTSEVDDAFQAAFLVLVRKSRRIKSRHLLGPWLYTVAVRAARKVLAVKQRTQSRERSVNPMPEPILPGEAEPNDWLGLLDDALQSLPDKYRVPLILCELEGQSRVEAAQNLALPEGTLSSRLARGRELLRQRLLRRSVAVSATALAGALATQASAAVPPALLLSTTQAALTGHTAAAALSLTQGVLHAMFMSKLKLFAGVFAALALVATGGIIAWPTLGAQDQAAKGKSDQELLQGTWRVVSLRGEQGKTIDGDEADRIGMGRLVFKVDKLTFRGACDYKLNPAGSPKEIDIIPREGPEREKDQTFPGIYELKRQELRIGFSGPGQARPAKFEDPMSMLFVLKKEKP
ncbi:MAG TPA: sigma-70 family RNA polymerase sigma factor [Gemmataceae bacterium]|nr:sigma-70 family RNA polymerase sigma factor [Gemmataceae bacterium]